MTRSPLAKKINAALADTGVAILPPMDAFDSIRCLVEAGIKAQCTILDPWYNKGIGGEMPLEEYDAFIYRLLDACAPCSDHLFLWGFPEIVGTYARYTPGDHRLTAWLTWYYKNCPSVIRGWRSSQNACLHFSTAAAKQHPENFLTEEQLDRFREGKMRFIPGPSSVIESPLIIGFVGKKEQTGHPSQKPEAVYEKLVKMATAENDLIFDPMGGLELRRPLPSRPIERRSSAI